MAMLSLLVLFACAPGGGEGRDREANAPLAVHTAPVVAGAVPLTVPLAGTVVAAREARVAADSNGVVVEVGVEPGQAVQRGDVLVVLDARLAALQAAASRAQAAASEAQLAAAVADCERTAELAQAGLVSASVAERARSGCDASRAGLEAARASAELAGTALGKTRVRAPFDGVVGDRLVEVGDFVGAAQPVATLYGAGPMAVEFSVPERIAGQVSLGAPVWITVAGVPVPGAVSRLSGAIRLPARDRLAEAVLTGGDGLIPGQFVQVELELGQGAGLLVPASAVQATGSARRVFVARQQKAVETLVRTGARVGESWVVESGLAAGDLVVLEPPAELGDGRALE